MATSCYWSPSIGIAIFVTALAMSGTLLTFRSPAWGAVELVILAVTLTFLALTVLTDPGFIPRKPTRDPLLDVLQELARDKLQNARSLQIKVQHEGIEYKRTLGHRGAWTRIVPGRTKGYRYCTMCNIWRPPHGHHCGSCGRCVAHFDHHCDTLGTCIGGLNHRWFTLFLLSALTGACLLTVGSAMTIWHFVYQRAPLPWYFWAACAMEPFYMYSCLVATFGCFHCVLMCIDVSSKDCIKQGCCTCNEDVCAPGGCRYLLQSWWRQCFGRVTCLCCGHQSHDRCSSRGQYVAPRNVHTHAVDGIDTRGGGSIQEPLLDTHEDVMGLATVPPAGGLDLIDGVWLPGGLGAEGAAASYSANGLEALPPGVADGDISRDVRVAVEVRHGGAAEEASSSSLLDDDVDSTRVDAVVTGAVRTAAAPGAHAATDSVLQ